MFLTHITQYFRSLLKPHVRWERHLLSPQQMDDLLRRERSRADRTQDAFSLLKYTSREEATVDATMKRLVKILRGRLRFTDEIGLLEQGCIGVILPSTPGQGAVKVADDILLLFPTDLTPPQCEIFTYPYDWKNKTSEGVRIAEHLSSATPLVQPMDVLFCEKLREGKEGMNALIAFLGLLLLIPLYPLISLLVFTFSKPSESFHQETDSSAHKYFRLYLNAKWASNFHQLSLS